MKPKPITSLVSKFRSSVSGLWYDSPHAAGTVDAVELNGEKLFRTKNEGAWGWIKRVSAWATKIHERSDSNEVKP